MTDVEMSDVAEQNFHLSGVVAASKTDIKDIVTTGTDIIIAGREEKIKFLKKRDGEYAVYKEISQSPGLQINSLAYYKEQDEWLLFAGRKNGSIAVYNRNFEEVTAYTHHNSNVCCLHIDTTHKKLLSGSWDNNVIIWPIEQLLSERFQALLLTGHTMSVWALATFKERAGTSLSASADKSIKLWQDDNCIRTYNGHKDVVRCLQTLSNDTFVSAANDSTYRVWHIESSEALYVFQSHFEDFIFSLTLMGNQLISCGETGFVEVWNVEKTDAGERLKHCQSLRTPAITNWAVAPVTDNEFAVGTNEGVVYLFSSDPEKRAPSDVLKTVEELMSEKTVAELMRKEQQENQEIVIKVALDDGTPNLELRYRKGSDPAIAAENFIRANNLPISYLAEITEYIVTNIPEAKQAQNKKYQKQPTQKINIDGELYDFAMDVTIDKKPLKMPFNVSDDPNAVAWKFCEKNNVPVKYAPQFAELVRKELQGVTKNTTSDFYDPFTGGGRYVPSSSDTVSSGGADPLTGSGRYIPSSSSNSFSAAGDPFTSGGRYIPGSAEENLVPNASRPADKLRPRCELVPMTEFYLFRVDGAANPKALAKLKETNDLQQGCKLNDEQLAAMEGLLGGQTGKGGDLETSALELGLLWPFNDIGIIIDLLRCALLHAELNKYFCDEAERGSTTRNRIFEILVSNPPSTVKVFTCRAITNAFAHPEGQQMLVAYDTNFSQLVSQVVACFLTDATVTAARQLQIAAASALANWSFLLLKRSEKVAELGPREDVLRAIIAKLETVDSFGDKDEVAMIRLLQAIVTLMWGDKEVIQTAKKRNITSIVNKLKDAVVNEAGKNIARCIVEITFVV